MLQQTVGLEFFQKFTTINGGKDVKLRINSVHSEPLIVAFDRTFEALVLSWGKEAALKPRMFASKVRQGRDDRCHCAGENVIEPANQSAKVSR